jgi:transcription elongation factor GreA
MNEMKQIQITKEGFEALKDELGGLVKKRPELVDRLERARSEGDITENSAYIDSKEELEFLDGKIDELKHVIDNAVVLKKKMKGDRVAFGTKVTVKLGKAEQIFYIVGEWEADPMKQKISYESPLGRALDGKRVGERVEVEAPVGKVVYEILSID